MKTNKNLPKPLTLRQTLGPSFILLGLALGSGELILWPYLAANYGLGLMWGGLLGITFQYILNTEIMRYSLAWGESIFVGFRKLAKMLPLWFIFSTFIPWSLPGFSSAASQILANVFSFQNEKLFAIFLLLLTGTILTLGKTLYRTMELFQKTIIFAGLSLIIFLTFRLTGSSDWQQLSFGLIGRGNGWWFFPPGIAIASFLGAFAYSGAGGNLNLAQSYYIKEKGLGMGKWSGKITSLFSPGKKEIKLEGERFKDTIENRKRWIKWWSLITKEHFIIFWGLGFLTIILLAVLSKSLVYGASPESGLTFLYHESDQITGRLNDIFGLGFLIVAASMLFSTQVGVLESSSRIISENFLLLRHKKGTLFNPSKAFYIALWAQILFGVAMLLYGIEEPRFLLTLSAVLNAVAMMVCFPLVYLLNKKHLPSKYQPNFRRRATMLLAFLFFIIFVIITFANLKI